MNCESDDEKDNLQSNREVGQVHSADDSSEQDIVDVAEFVREGT